MTSRHTSFCPLLRSFAAATLSVWIAAQVLCFAHCNFGFGHGASEQASCHGSAPTPAHHDDGDSSGPAHHDSSAGDACTTLNSALVGGGSAALVEPDSHLLYTLALFAFGFDVTAMEPTAVLFRQAQTRDWVFTPEVCLGPAHRSHAPPVLS